MTDAEKLLALARKAAGKAKLGEKPLPRADALAAAPWKDNYAPSLEKAFREAFANEFEQRGAAKPRLKSGASGTVLTDEQRAAYGEGRLTLRISQASIDKLTAHAQRLKVSRAALIESLVASLK